MSRMHGTRKITATPKEIADMYWSGMSQQEIGRKFGVTRAGVSLFMVRHNIKTRAEHRRRPRERRLGKPAVAMCVARLYLAEHRTLTEIAEQFGVSISTVALCLQRQNVPRKRRGPPLKLGLTKAQLEHLYYTESHSFVHIARQEGCCSSTVRSAMIRLGILPKDKIRQLKARVKQLEAENQGLRNALDRKEDR